jgi:CheY-like chemotaxis protein
MLKRIIGEDIHLQCSYAARSPFVQADVGMLEQVLVNLVVNSRDAMPRGGQLIIGTELRSFDTAQTDKNRETRCGRFVALSVRDTGTGISAEHLPRIFEPFFTTKEVGKGTGLGLATVYGIVKQHDGWIDVTTEVGVGSTFTLFLPAIDCPAAQAQGTPAVAPPLRGSETVLLVEDEEQVRALTRRVLETYGYQVHDAASGNEALELCRTKAPQIDLLLTDVIMPGGVTGRELAEKLTAQYAGLKVIFTSGYSGEVLERSTEFVRRIKSRFLSKPCSPRELLVALRQALDGN